MGSQRIRHDRDSHTQLSNRFLVIHYVTMSNILILLIAATGKRCTFLKIFIKEINDLKMCVKIQLEDGKVLKEELIFIESIIPKLLCYLSPPFDGVNPLCMCQVAACSCPNRASVSLELKK